VNCLTVDDLVRATRRPRSHIVNALNAELALGRVIEVDGMYALVTEAFAPGEVAALAALDRPTVRPVAEVAA